MATTAAAASPAGTPGAVNSGASTPAPGRPQLKTTTSSASNVTRRPAHSPSEGPQRRNSQQKAWNTNNQPKYSQNGVQSPNMGGPQGANRPRATETDTQDKHLHDRMKYIIINLVGRQVTVTTKDGSKFTGVLATASPSGDLGCALKLATRIKSAGPPDAKSSENTPVGGTDERTMVFKAEDVAHIVASNVTFGEVDVGKAATNGSGFRTDADITASTNYNNRGERELRRWEPSQDDPVSMSLEDSSGSAGWDQFAVNEKLFGVKTDFDENIYTTKLDKSHPLYAQREARAAKLAREIETSGGSVSAHVAEERGLQYDDSGMDEEDKYSGVQRPQQFAGLNQNPNRYAPPARRQPTQPSANNVSSVESDPAILSSQRAPSKPVSPAPNTSAAPEVKTPATAAPAISTQKPAALATLPVSVPKAADPAKAKDATAIKESLGLKLPPIPALKSANSTTTSGSGSTQPQLINHFRQFVTSEKERVEKRLKDHHRAKRDKDDKMTELKKFAESFKLNTPVPTDLIPILAKDKAKQALIVEKSKQAVAASQEPKPAVTKAQTTTVSATTAASAATTQAPTAAAAQQPATPNQYQDRQQQNRFNNQGKNMYIPQPDYGNKGNLPFNQRNHQGPPLGHRLQGIQQHRSQQQRYGNHMQPMRGPMQQDHIQNAPTGPSAGVPPKTVSPTPSAGARMNAKAMEFRPNPNAISFTPTFGSAATPNMHTPPMHPFAQQQHQQQQQQAAHHQQQQQQHHQQQQQQQAQHHAQQQQQHQQHQHQQARATSPTAFFGNKKIKPASERPSINDHFNPFKKTKPHVETQGDHKYKSVIAPPFLTPPVWSNAEIVNGKKWSDMFDRQEWQPNTMAPPHMQHSQSQQGHHVPSGPHGHPQQVPHMGMPPQFDPEQMRHQGGPQGGPPPMSGVAIPPYGSPAGPHGPVMYQGYGPGGPGGPAFRYGYGGQFVQPGGPGAHMMPGQPPMPYGPGMNAPFVPQMAYSPSQMPAVPFPGGPPPPPSSTGYPSPRRPAAPMMMHTNSTQGQSATPQMVPMAMGPNAFVPGAQQPSESHVGLPHRPPTVPPSLSHRYSRAASPAIPQSPSTHYRHVGMQQSGSGFHPAASPAQSYALQRSQTVGMSNMGASRGGGFGSPYAGHVLPVPPGSSGGPTEPGTTNPMNGPTGYSDGYSPAVIHGYPPPHYQQYPNHQGPQHYGGPSGRGPYSHHGQGPMQQHGHQAPPMAVSQSQQPPDTSAPGQGGEENK